MFPSFINWYLSYPYILYCDSLSRDFCCIVVALKRVRVCVGKIRGLKCSHINADGLLIFESC